MSISMYQASVPVLIRGLTNLQHILGKAQAHAAEKQIDPSVFVGARLCGHAAARPPGLHRDRHGQGLRRALADVEIPSYPDVEQTFDELHARIQKTIDYLKASTARRSTAAKRARSC